MLSPVDEAPIPLNSKRRIGALVSEFSGVAPLLASSDLIATLPTIIMAGDMETYGLTPSPQLGELPPFRARFFWSSRTANDPALIWIRNLVLDAYRVAHNKTETSVRTRLASYFQ